MDLLAVNQISHSFRGLRVLRGVSFTVAEGSITGLIGPNGAGKSTLFNIVSGFLRPTGGEIQYAGRIVTRDTVQQRSRAGLVRTFQTPHVFRDLTVRENLIVGRYRNGQSGLLSAFVGLGAPRRELREADALAEATAEQFHLARVLDEPASRLPAGQQRLVELARAAIGEPRLLCLDEPSSGLSAREVDELTEALHRLNAAGVTVLLVSHDMELMAVSNSIHVLCFGEIIARGDLPLLRGDQRVREAYLGM